MFITIGNFMQCSPRAQVAPPEIGDVYINIIRLLENTVIDRDIGAKRETFIDEFFLVGRVEKIFPLVEFLVISGRYFLNASMMLFTLHKKIPEFQTNSPLSTNFFANS